MTKNVSIALSALIIILAVVICVAYYCQGERIIRMINEKIKKVRLKGNESFNFREGWLRKGMRCVKDNNIAFSENDIMEMLGVGSKMVKSIKYWLLATNICEEKYVNNGKNRALVLTEDFGAIIDAYDKYFDDVFTYFILHYHLVANDKLCILWNIFFNEFSGAEFSKEDMVNACSELLGKKLEEGTTFSSSLLADDCSSILKMYLPADFDDDPEDNLQCPLNMLGLLSRSNKGKNIFFKSSPSKESLNKLAVLYVIVSNLEKNNNHVNIRTIVEAPNNAGRVFNLNRVSINEYLDQLRASGYLTISRTAGLDMVYINENYTPRDVLVKYYTSVLER